MTKLTAADVLAIRAARARGEALKSIARRFAVSHQQVSRIARGRTWRHVKGAA